MISENHNIVLVCQSKRGSRPLIQQIGIKTFGTQQRYLLIQRAMSRLDLGKLLLKRIDGILQAEPGDKTVATIDGMISEIGKHDDADQRYQGLPQAPRFSCSNQSKISHNYRESQVDSSRQLISHIYSTLLRTCALDSKIANKKGLHTLKNVQPSLTAKSVEGTYRESL